MGKIDGARMPAYRWGHPYDELMDADCKLHADAPRSGDGRPEDFADMADTQAYVAAEFWNEVVSDEADDLVGGLTREKKAEYVLGSLVYGVDACYWMLQAIYREMMPR